MKVRGKVVNELIIETDSGSSTSKPRVIQTQDKLEAKSSTTISDATTPPTPADALIKQRFEEGEALTDIAVDFNISPQRVWQIVRGM